MILLDSFYTITKQADEPGSVKASVTINKSHAIFEGHFPGTPIVPGVCMMQMAREIMEVHTHSVLNLVKADSIKFLSMLNPEVNSDVEVELSYGVTDKTYQIAASIAAGSQTFFK